MATGLTRWTPTADLFRDRFGRLFDQAFSDLRSTFETGEDVASRNWLPAVDISETEDALQLYAELPGMTRDDVDITLENNLLSIRGERKFEKDVKKENFHRIERTYGSFSRTFTLPSNVRSDEVKASFKDGVLHIEIPKAEEAKPRKIAIK